MSSCDICQPLPLRCRVLLFSTMTKLLDLLEVYLRWRQLPEVRQAGRFTCR